jgi:hypothetical protein
MAVVIATAVFAPQTVINRLDPTITAVATIAIAAFTYYLYEAAAERLAQMGARVVLVARDRARGEAALARLPGVIPVPR